MRILLFATLIPLGFATALTAQSQPLLQLQGEPYFGGSVTLHLSGTVGQPALLAYGLDALPLNQPAFTAKGPWYIGSLMNLIGLGAIPSTGRLDLPFTMPPVLPALAGIDVVMQAFVPTQLSNPAVLPLDLAYFQPSSASPLVSPAPAVGALFGDTWAVGDLNADGINDLAVGAWFEDVAGIDKAGRVYVLWGPEFTSSIVLQSAEPISFGIYGACVVIADVSGDGIEDLLVSETPGDPPEPLRKAELHIFHGAASFPTIPSQTIESPGTGVIYTLFCRSIALGDYNGDGELDIAHGNLKEVVSGKADAGRIDVYWGPSFSSMLSIPNPTPVESDFFGSALATADVNGDGVEDLIEGSGRADGMGIVNVGRVHVFVGPALSLAHTIENPLPQGFNSRFGQQVHGADFDGDGRDEVVACDLRNRIYLFWSPDFVSYADIPKPSALDTIPSNSVAFGYFLSSGDVNGDGLEDLLISDPIEGQAACSVAKEGTVFLTLAPHFSTFLILGNPLPACGDEFSWHAALIDVDDDGVVDLVAPSETADSAGVQNSGLVWIIMGGSGG